MTAAIYAFADINRRLKELENPGADKGPLLTVNEMRSRIGLPAIEGGDNPLPDGAVIGIDAGGTDDRMGWYIDARGAQSDAWAKLVSELDLRTKAFQAQFARLKEIEKRVAGMIAELPHGRLRSGQDFNVYSDEKDAKIRAKRLQYEGYADAKVVKRKGYGWRVESTKP